MNEVFRAELSNEIRPRVSRRRVIESALALAVMANCSTPRNLNPFLVPNEYVGLNQEEDLSQVKNGLLFCPDTRLPYVKGKEGNITYFLSGATAKTYPASYAIAEKFFLGFKPVDVDSRGNLVSVVRPDPAQVNYSHYRALSSIIRPSQDLGHLIGFTHDERWGEDKGRPTPVGATWSVGRVESRDRGFTWIDRGTILTGQDVVDPRIVDKPTGVGQPSAIVVEENGQKYVYLYYFEITSWQKVQKPDQIYLARAEISEDGKLGPFLYKTEDGFKSKNDQLKSVGVIPPPQNIRESVFTALPDIKYNRYLKRYQVLFEVNPGLCLSFSDNGINWTEPKLIYKYPTPIIDVRTRVGGLWYSNGTMISPKEEDNFVDKSGYLYMSKGDWGRSPHQMVRIPFEFI